MIFQLILDIWLYCWHFDFTVDIIFNFILDIWLYCRHFNFILDKTFWLHSPHFDFIPDVILLWLVLPHLAPCIAPHYTSLADRRRFVNHICCKSSRELAFFLSFNHRIYIFLGDAITRGPSEIQSLRPHAYILACFMYCRLCSGLPLAARPISFSQGQ